MVSKAEGRIVLLADVRPSERAIELAGQLGKEPALVQVVLDESTEVLRAERGVLICETTHGFVCANAGVDSSNVAERRGLASPSTIPTLRRAGSARSCARRQRRRRPC